MPSEVYGSVSGSLAGAMVNQHSMMGKASSRSASIMPANSISGKYINMCCVGSLLFGYGISVLNTMQKALQNEFKWSDQKAQDYFSYLSTAIFVGAAIGAFSGGVISAYGRRTLNMILHLIFIIGGSICAFANGFVMLLVGRLLMGFAVGLVTVASPMVISEISPLLTRGANGVRHQLAITMGILLGIAIAKPLAKVIPSYYMRIMLGLPSVISLFALLAFTFWLRSETPIYLLLKGKTEEAIAVLRLIYGKTDVETEFQAISVSDSSENATVPLYRAILDPWYRKTILVGVFLAMSQQFIGINCFVSLSNGIFESAGIKDDLLAYANTGMSVMNFLMTFPAIYTIDLLGRKSLYIIGSLGSTIFLALVPLSIMFFPSVLPVLSVVSVLGFVVFFALSTGPVLWVYLNEIFPSEIQSSACGLCSASNWIAGIIMVCGVSKFNDPKYTLQIFSVFCVASFICLIFSIFVVKETRGISNNNSPYLVGRKKAGEQKRLLADGESKNDV